MRAFIPILTLVLLTPSVFGVAETAAERRNARIDAFLLDSMRSGGIDAWSSSPSRRDRSSPWSPPS